MNKSHGQVYDAQNKRIRIDSDYAQRFLALRSASAAIGNTTSRTRLAWVVDFINDDVARLGASSLTEYANGLLVLAGWAVAPNCVGGIELPPAPTPADVVEAHAALRQIIFDAVSLPILQRVSIPAEGLEIGLFRVTSPSAKPAAWAVRYGGPFITLVLYAVKDLILSAGDRLVKCRFCETPLVAVRKQQFCTERCAQTYRNDKRAQNAVAKKERSRHDKTTRAR